MKVNLGIWDKLTPVVIFLVFVAGILLVAVWYLPLIKENERYRKDILRLDNLVQKEEETVKQLRTSIDTLRYDPKAVEKVLKKGGSVVLAGAHAISIASDFRWQAASTRRASPAPGRRAAARPGLWSPTASPHHSVAPATRCLS